MNKEDLILQKLESMDAELKNVRSERRDVCSDVKDVRSEMKDRFNGIDADVNGYCHRWHTAQHLRQHRP